MFCRRNSSGNGKRGGRSMQLGNKCIATKLCIQQVHFERIEKKNLPQWKLQILLQKSRCGKAHLDTCHGSRTAVSKRARPPYLFWFTHCWRAHFSPGKEPTVAVLATTVAVAAAVAVAIAATTSRCATPHRASAPRYTPSKQYMYVQRPGRQGSWPFADTKLLSKTKPEKMTRAHQLQHNHHQHHQQLCRLLGAGWAMKQLLATAKRNKQAASDQ